MPSSHVILGGGIYGASIGYYLAQRGAPSIIVESQPEAATASGSAGFLAAAGEMAVSPSGSIEHRSKFTNNWPKTLE